MCLTTVERCHQYIDIILSVIDDTCYCTQESVASWMQGSRVTAHRNLLLAGRKGHVLLHTGICC